MRPLIFVFCLVTAFCGYAQVPEKFRKNRKSQNLPNARLLVKLAPLAAIDAMSFPTITGGVEVHLAPQFSLYNEVGIRYRKGWPEVSDTQFVSPGGFKLKSEFRYYFKEGNIHTRFHGHYIAMNGFFTNQKYNSTVEYNSKDYYSSSALKDDIGVTKSVWGLNALWGWQDDLGKRFMFEVYEGIGIRIRNYKTVNQQFNYDRDEVIEPDDVAGLWRAQYARRAGKGGSSATFNYTTGIRFIYKIY